MSAPHAITIGPSAAVIVDANGRVSELPKARSATYRARCTCGWRSVEYASEAQAKAMGGAHVRGWLGRQRGSYG